MAARAWAKSDSLSCQQRNWFSVSARQPTSANPPAILLRDKARFSLNDLSHDIFGLWILGPNPATYANKYGTPIYMYNFRLAKDGGAPRTFGPYGFSSTGWGLSTIDVVPGSYRVEMFVVDRDSQAETLVGTREFSIGAGGGEHGTTPTSDAAGVWDVFVGGLLGTPDENTTHYHAVLTITRNGPSYAGSLRFDDIGTTEVLADVAVAANGELTFTRLPLLGRKVDQYYRAVVSDNKLTGTLTDKTYNQKWWGTSKAR